MFSPELLPPNDNVLMEVLERLSVLRDQLVSDPATLADLVIAALLAELGTQLVEARISGSDDTPELQLAKLVGRKPN